MDDIDRFAQYLTQGPGNQVDRIARLYGLARRANETDGALWARINVSQTLAPAECLITDIATGAVVVGNDLIKAHWLKH